MENGKTAHHHVNEYGDGLPIGLNFPIALEAMRALSYWARPPSISLSGRSDTPRAMEFPTAIGSARCTANRPFMLGRPSFRVILAGGSYSVGFLSLWLQYRPELAPPQGADRPGRLIPLIDGSGKFPYKSSNRPNTISINHISAPGGFPFTISTKIACYLVRHFTVIHTRAPPGLPCVPFSRTCRLSS